VSALRVGIVGCGEAANLLYIPNSHQFRSFQFVACADAFPDRAQALADATGLEALSVERLMANEGIDAILNLTSPMAHVETSLQAISSGKHVYSEKPLATDSTDGLELLRAAAKANVRVGCAPDTFLGAGLSTARRLVGEGILGSPVGAEFLMQHSGVEHFHPRPQAWYEPGGGPLFDMGPYYLTPLVRMFGPIGSVEAMARATGLRRKVLVGPDAGKTIQTHIPTHIVALLQFDSGFLTTMTMSFDCAFYIYTFNLHGRDGSMRLPDPDQFAGPLYVRRRDDDDWGQVALDSGIAGEGRGIGLADFADAIKVGRPHRASAAIGLHLVDVMSAILTGTQVERAVPVTRLDSALEEVGGELPGVDLLPRGSR
jgi:predicted dehydrogenase